MAAQYKVYLTCRYPLCKNNGPYSMWTMQEHMAYHIKDQYETTEHFSMRCTVKDCHAFFVGKAHAEEHARSRRHTIVPTFHAITGKSDGSLKYQKAMRDFVEPLGESKQEPQNHLEQPRQSQEDNASQENWTLHSSEDDPCFPPLFSNTLTGLPKSSAATFAASPPDRSAMHSHSSFSLAIDTPLSPPPLTKTRKTTIAVDDMTSAIEALANDYDPGHDLRLQNRPSGKPINRERIDSGFSEQTEGSPLYNLKRRPGFKKNNDTSNDDRGMFLPRKSVPRRTGAGVDRNDGFMMPDERTHHPLAGLKDKGPPHERKGGIFDMNTEMGVKSGHPRAPRYDDELAMNNVSKTYLTSGGERQNEKIPLDCQRTRSTSFVEGSLSISPQKNPDAMKTKGCDDREVLCEDLVVRPFRSSIPAPPGFGSGSRRTVPPLRYQSYYAESVTSPQKMKREAPKNYKKPASPDSADILCLDDKPIAPLDEPDAFSTAVQDGRDSDGEEIAPRPLFPTIKREEPSPDPDPVDVVPRADDPTEASKKKEPEKNLYCVFNSRWEGRDDSERDINVRIEKQGTAWENSGSTRKRHLDKTAYNAFEKPPPAPRPVFNFVNLKSPDYRQKRSRRSPFSPPPARRRRSPSLSYGNSQRRRGSPPPSYRNSHRRRRCSPPPRAPSHERRRSSIRERSYSHSPPGDF